jgi:uncharacterized damage-inducible protein DinB
MYRTIEDFTDDWRQETSSTLRIFRTLTDASLTQRVTGEGRSLGFLAWHITKSLGEVGDRAGLHVPLPADDISMPAKAADIVGTYLSTARSLGDEVRQHWNNSSLEEEVDMYGEKWKRGFALAALIRHQTHHCGQMTVLMRQAGLLVAGVCGPSKEEWARWGMPAKE